MSERSSDLSDAIKRADRILSTMEADIIHFRDHVGAGLKIVNPDPNCSLCAASKQRQSKLRNQNKRKPY